MPYIDDGFIEDGYFGPDGWLAITVKKMRVLRETGPIPVEGENRTVNVTGDNRSVDVTGDDRVLGVEQ